MGTIKNPASADGAAGRANGLVNDNIQDRRRNVKARLAEYLKAKGIEPNYNGMIHCPWHEDSTPSCKVNDEYIYCFGCNESGNVYEVAAALLGLPCDKEHFRTIAADVERALGLPELKPSERRGKSNPRFRLSESAVYRSELHKELIAAIDSGDEERARDRAYLLAALYELPGAL